MGEKSVAHVLLVIAGVSVLSRNEEREREREQRKKTEAQREREGERRKKAILAYMRVSSIIHA